MLGRTGRELKVMRLIMGLCALGLVLFLAGRHFYAGPDDHPVYLALASARVHISDQEQGDAFFAAVDKFSRDHRYESWHGDFSMDNRIIYNAQITVSPTTFFRIVNIRDAGIFDVAIYSHDQKQAWVVSWNDLMARLEAILPDSAIERTKKPSGA
jgi:hypothetical protein